MRRPSSEDWLAWLPEEKERLFDATLRRIRSLLRHSQRHSRRRLHPLPAGQASASARAGRRCFPSLFDRLAGRLARGLAHPGRTRPSLRHVPPNGRPAAAWTSSAATARRHVARANYLALRWSLCAPARAFSASWPPSTNWIVKLQRRRTGSPRRLPTAPSLRLPTAVDESGSPALRPEHLPPRNHHRSEILLMRPSRRRNLRPSASACSPWLPATSGSSLLDAPAPVCRQR